jgi:hypothetical protein
MTITRVLPRLRFGLLACGPWPFTGGLAPERIQKPLGMRRNTLKSNRS